jgi:cytochrome c-type biogenesis protein CcmH
VTAGGPSPARRVLRWAPWGLLLVGVVVALAVGASRPTHESIAQRTVAIAGEVRCPVCQGETAAESSTAPSVAIRNQIHSELVAGERPSAILAGIEAEYGAGILEKPPASGVDLFLWVVPVVAVVLAIAGLAAAFAHWRPRRRSASVSEADRLLVAGALAPDPPAPAETSEPVAATGPAATGPAATGPAVDGGVRR